MQNDQNQYIKTTGNERLKIIVILSVFAYRRKLTPFVILKKKKSIFKKREILTVMRKGG
jgi:hypothetical protein